MKVLSIKDRLQLMVFAFGVFISYFIFGIYHQKIYDENTYDERFTFASTFVVLQCFVYFVVARVVTMSHDAPKNETPHKYFIFAAIFYLLASITSNWALQYIDYVVQVVGKSCKPITVMIFGVLFARKSYTVQKYFFVLMIVFGVAMFLYKDTHKENVNSKPLIGNILIGVSLLTEGMLGGVQDKMRVVAKPTALNFMAFINMYGTLLSLPLLLINFEGLEFVRFCMRNYKVMIDLAIVLISGTSGQFFVTAVITHYGSLPLSIVTTVRKFCTVLFSALFIKEVLSVRQWIATMIIFGALFLDVLFGKKKFGKAQEEKPKEVVATVSEVMRF